MSQSEFVQYAQLILQRSHDPIQRNFKLTDTAFKELTHLYDSEHTCLNGIEPSNFQREFETFSQESQTKITFELYKYSKVGYAICKIIMSGGITIILKRKVHWNELTKLKIDLKNLNFE